MVNGVTGKMRDADDTRPTAHSGRNKKGRKLLPGRGLSVAGSALGSHDLLEWAWLEVEVALDRESQRPPNRFELGEHEVAPLLLKAADVAEETKIVLLCFAFRDVPGPVGIRRENLVCTIGSGAFSDQ